MGLISVLHTFVKYNSDGMPQIKPKKKKKKKKKLRRRGNWCIQPTATFRRKIYIESRKLQKAGRPLKCNTINEHGYNKRKVLSSINNLPIAMKKALRSIGHCVNIVRILI